MAIDSLLKRRSALFFGRGAHTIRPAGTLTQADRQDMLGVYRGLLAMDPFQTVTLESVSVDQPVVTPTTPQPGVSCSVSQPTVTVTEKNDIR